jgi:anti-sigma factor RsiW
MHYEAGRLIAYLDDEVPPSERGEIEKHVASCDECREAVAGLEADRRVAAEALDRLQPTGELVPLPLESAPTQPPRRFGWGAVAAASIAALLLVSFAFEPVRSGAAGLLQVFRVESVETIDLTADDIRQISEALESGEGRVDLKAMGEMWIEGGKSEARSVTTQEARAAVDFPVKLPDDASGEPSFTLQPAQSYRFKLNVAAANEALKSYGSEEGLPADIDGKVFSVEVPAVVLAEYKAGSGDADVIVVGQSRSPQLIVPDDVDAAQVRQVMLNLPFLPDQVRAQLASITDWQSTLIVPNVEGSASDITLDGVPAVVITRDTFVPEEHLSSPPSVTVIWNDDGVLRAVGGPVDEETAIALAKSTMR